MKKVNKMGNPKHGLHDHIWQLEEDKILFHDAFSY